MASSHCQMDSADLDVRFGNGSPGLLHDLLVVSTVSSDTGMIKRSLMKSFTTNLLVILLCCLVMTDVLDACPNCKDGLHQRNGFAGSILLLMSMPFCILCFWVQVFYKAAFNRTDDD